MLEELACWHRLQLAMLKHILGVDFEIRQEVGNYLRPVFRSEVNDVTRTKFLLRLKRHFECLSSELADY